MRLIALALSVFLISPLALAQDQSAPGQPTPALIEAAPEAPPPPSDDLGAWRDRIWISGQANFIRQAYPDFYAKYSGPNSLQPGAEHATSRVLTLYTGARLTKYLDFLFDLEEAGGGGLSQSLGVAGFPNLDVVRNPSLSKAPYVARVMLHGVLPLGQELEESTQNPLSLSKALPVHRLEFHLGKMSTVDFFDLNSIGSDSHLQFMNWATVNNAAFDYAADTRGYTYGLVVEYYDRAWAFRFGEMLMPTVANGITLDWDLARARGENFEFEFHPVLLKNRQTAIRPLAYINHANMGSYQETIDDYLAGLEGPVPDITLTRKQGRVKYGFGLNVEQELTRDLRGFMRLGWDDGHTESFAYTEVDHTAVAGLDLRGKSWRRPEDKVGVAYIVDGISAGHARYLQLGGLGFLLGDGNLNYGLERILETYYTLHVWRGVSLATDLQQIVDPGYNRDRGPVLVYSFRLHLEEGLQSLRATRN